MQVLPTKFDTVKLIIPDVFTDDRGYFKETFSAARYEDAGIRGPFVQDNTSFSRRGVLRGIYRVERGLAEENPRILPTTIVAVGEVPA